MGFFGAKVDFSLNNRSSKFVKEFTNNNISIKTYTKIYVTSNHFIAMGWIDTPWKPLQLGTYI